MYGKSAQFYDALHHFKDYRREAQEIRNIISGMHPDCRAVLDVACGTGMHIKEMGDAFELAGIDLNPEFIRIARERCPNASFHVSDMAEFDIGTKFDVITCLFSSIALVRTYERLVSTLQRMAAHLNPGGLVIVEPWFGPDNYWVGHIAANHVDLPDLKITWMHRSSLKDGLSVLDNHFLVGTPEKVEHFNEVYELGLFSREDHFAAFAQAGLEAEYRDGGPTGRGVYLARSIQAAA